MTFVPSTEIPDSMAEKLAKYAHARGCGSFDGEKPRSAPSFSGQHRAHDLVSAKINLSDVCNALKVTPEQIAALAEGGPTRPYERVLSDDVEPGDLG